MIFTENSKQAVVFLRQAVPKMMEHSIVPNPFNFTLWYSYFSKQFPLLNQELDYIIDRYNTCPPEMSEKLFLKHIIKIDENTEDVQKAYQQGIVDLVENLSVSIDVTIQESYQFSSALNENIVQLGECSISDVVQGVLGDLSRNASSLCSVTDALQSKMVAAQTEIDSLKKELETSKEQANTDSLTGLSNRRVFETIYNKVVAVSNGRDISLIIMDIDKFKLFNDNFGHLMGDQVLKLVGQLLKEECKDPLIPIRFGGEEFVLLCPESSIKEAYDIAENIRVKLSRIALSNKRTGEKLPPVTASFGVTVSDGTELLHAVIERADKALYLAKESGRNRVQIAI
ncbi:MAG: hypothetical protein OFPII_30900 [Osedax symbiont Rs1]|nr:MAG: hypothetical protein OFPII_30900 [Osedax symbiont Rs1]